MKFRQYLCEQNFVPKVIASLKKKQ